MSLEDTVSYFGGELFLEGFCFPLCCPQKYPYIPHGGTLKIPCLRVLKIKPNLFLRKASKKMKSYQQTRTTRDVVGLLKPFVSGSMDISWRKTHYLFLAMLNVLRLSLSDWSASTTFPDVAKSFSNFPRKNSLVLVFNNLWRISLNTLSMTKL